MRFLTANGDIEISCDIDFVLFLIKNIYLALNRATMLYH